MDRKEVETKKDLYIYEIESSTFDLAVYNGIMVIVAVLLALFKCWLPLAVLFFSFMIGSFAGEELTNYRVYSEKFRDLFGESKK